MFSSESDKLNGFTPEQIKTLREFRNKYRQGFMNADPLLPRRLEFARWLVQHGRLSEYPKPEIPQAKTLLGEQRIGKPLEGRRG